MNSSSKCEVCMTQAPRNAPQSHVPLWGGSHPVCSSMGTAAVQAATQDLKIRI